MKEIMDYILADQWLSAAVVFVTQLIYIWLRTGNIIHTSEKNKKKAVVSSFWVSITWLISMAIGLNSVLTGSIPPIVAFLLGNTLGTYWGIAHSIRKDVKQDKN